MSNPIPPSRESRQAAIRRQVARVEGRLAEQRRRSDRWSLIRLGVFAGGAPVCFGLLFAVGEWAFWPAAIVWLAGFVAAVRVHGRIEAGIQRHAAWLAYQATRLARSRLDWEHIPPPPADPPAAEHPFATDLDLSGPRSLHHLISAAATREGSQRLLDWLAARVPDPARIAERQAALRELIPLTPFRARLHLAATLAARRGDDTAWEAQRLLRLVAQRRPADALRQTLILLGGLAGVNAVLLVLALGGASPLPWVAGLLLYAVIAILRRDLIEGLFDEAIGLTDGLRRVRAVLGLLEGCACPGRPRLAALLAPLQAREPGQLRPSTALRRLERIASAASLQGNPFVWMPLNILLPWDFFFAWRLEQHKTDLARRLPDWLNAWFELEALNSLADFATLNPEYTFPQVQNDRDHRPVLDGAALGHPLIPPVTRVCNDFRIEARGATLLLTGSNMSGKSSFLRTVGVNMQLAWAGSVVAAERLSLIPFRLFTCIRVMDSVTDGISYFYAEVRRLKALLDALDGQAADASERLPLFFLIDEIFRGTNNRERLIGSRAYIQALIGRGGTGLVATHDLELVHLAEDNPAVRNYHFREQIVNGRMHFDYRLRPGPCPTTNALVIMRLAGLPVEDGAA